MNGDGDSHEAPSTAEWIAFLIAREIRDGWVAVLGSYTPLALVAFALARATHAPSLCVNAFAGVDVPLHPPVSLLRLERRALQAPVVWDTPESIHTVYAQGICDAEPLSGAQIDGKGQVNLTRVELEGRSIILPGPAAVPELMASYRQLLYYAPRHEAGVLTDEVDFATGSPRASGDQELVLVTEIAVLRRPRYAETFALESIHGECTVEEVIERTGFEIEVRSDVSPTQPPGREQLELLRSTVDPLGVRDLETLALPERLEALERMAERELPQA